MISTPINRQLHRKRLKQKLFKLLPLIGLFLFGLVITLYQLPSDAAVVPFSIRYQTNDTGDIVFIGNTTLTCPTSNASCLGSQNGTNTAGQNNTFNMVNVDIDSDASTINSSSANLNLPSGSTVLFAGLYWGGDSTNAARTQVKFATPSSAYTTINSTSTYDGSGTAYTNSYQGFADVTAQVKAAGNGTYTVANVQSTTGSTNHWGGWSIVIAYRAVGQPPRNLTIFDGYNSVSTSTPTINISISGFRTPPFGAVKAKLGAIVYDGDSGVGVAGSTYTGDRFQLNGTDLSNASNPANDAFNSSITYLGSQVTTKNPNYVNQLGYDADIFDATGYITNNATSATLTLNTGGETFLPGVVTSAIDLYAPTLDIQKSVVDVNGGNVEIGDILEYTISTTNNKDANGNGDPANNNVLKDPIPANTTYVPGSIQITTGSNSTPPNKTDAAGDDQAEYDAVNKQVIYRLGSAANTTSGGTLSVNTGTSASPSAGSTTTVKFRVTVNASTPNGTLIINQAQETYTGQTLGTGTTLVGNSTASSVTVNTVRADLAITKTDGQTTTTAGSPINYTITVTNNGPTTVTSLTVSDAVPSTIQSPVFTPSTGTYSSSTGAWTGLNLATGQSITLTMAGTVSSAASGTLSNTATVAPPTGVTDPTATNNTATDTTNIYAVAPTAGQVIINEVLYRQSGAGISGNDEFIELYNTSASPVDLSNWQVSDGNLIANNTDGVGSITGSSSNPAYVFPSGTILAAGQYAVIWIGDNSSTHQAAGATFQIWLGQASKLNDAGDDIWLYDSQLRIVDYVAYGSGTGINTAPPAGLNLWNATYQGTLAGAAAGQSISLSPNGQDGNTSACWEATTSGQASGRCPSYLATRNTDSANGRITSVGASNNGVVASPPNLILVKRITAINGVNITTVVDDSGSTNDNAANWPLPLNAGNNISSYLQGAINGGLVQPGDLVDYTIYFLSNGGSPVTNVALCDLVPVNSTFIPTAFGSSPDSGIALSIGTTTTNLTNVPDGDAGHFFAPGVTPSVTCAAANTNGAVVVQVVKSPATLPNATTPGTSGSYGFIRFRAKVN